MRKFYVKEALNKMFENLAIYKKNMETLKKDLDRYNPPKMAADGIEEFIKNYSQ